MQKRIFELYYGRSEYVQYLCPDILRQSAHGDPHDQRNCVKAFIYLLYLILYHYIRQNHNEQVWILFKYVKYHVFHWSGATFFSKPIYFLRFFLLIVRGVVSNTRFTHQMDTSLDLYTSICTIQYDEDSWRIISMARRHKLPQRSELQIM